MKEKKVEAGAESHFRMDEDLLWGTHPVYEALQQEPERISELILHNDRKGPAGRNNRIGQRGRDKTLLVSSIHLTGPDAAQARHQGVARTSQVSLLP